MNNQLEMTVSYRVEGTIAVCMHTRRGGIFWYVVTLDYGTRLQPCQVIRLEVEWSPQKFHRREPPSSLIPKFRESLFSTLLPPFFPFFFQRESPHPR